MKNMKPWAIVWISTAILIVMALIILGIRL